MKPYLFIAASKNVQAKWMIGTNIFAVHLPKILFTSSYFPKPIIGAKP
jgi:hypothetical protein